MARTNRTYDKIYSVVAKRPGLHQADIAQEIQTERSVVRRALASNHNGKNLMMETKRGLLWPADYHPQTVADFLVFGMGLPPLDSLPTDVTAHCALTGISIEAGYPAMDVVPAAAGEFLDLLPGEIGGYFSENTARALKGTWNLGSRVIFEDGTHYHPLIARDSKQPERPCWSGLVRRLWPARRGENVLMILTTDVKKRVWHRARIGALGETTSIFIYDVADQVVATPQGTMVIRYASALSSVQIISWPILLETLDLIEAIYALGFMKSSIQCSLLRQWKLAQEIGIGEAIRLDKQLRPLREKPEFAMAVIIAQKKETENESATE